MQSIQTLTYLIFIFLLPIEAAFSQISGVVNQYTEVVTVDYVNHSVEVANPGFFAVNDRVLLIQMKGTEMVSTNTATFGDIVDINGAGLYEMATVCDVIGNDVLFQYQISNVYNPAGATTPRIQLVKVYSGTNETVTGTVSATAWNGTTGGIVAIELSGTLTLNADIDVSGQGFRGGVQAQGNAFCPNFFAGDRAAFYYPDNGITTDGGKKGEGIAEYILTREFGKGAQVNGGGGGNTHNAGGGGGSNYGAGGQGGNRNETLACTGNNPGLGGEALSGFGYAGGANNKVFMGGGGGAGHDNNNVGKDGGNGGGIVLIIADQIEGNGFSMLANGDTPTNAPGDGGSGGGGGGAILLSTNGYGATALTLSSQGGNGGTTSINCEGPGGGGSGGVVWTAIATGGMVTVGVNGGIAGVASSCSSSNGAGPGNTGTNQSGLTIPEEIVNLSTCVLSSPLDLAGELTRQQQVRLYWNPSELPQYAAISLERKKAGNPFSTITEVAPQTDQWIDESPYWGRNIYRMKIVSRDGSISYSNLVELQVQTFPRMDLTITPNPVRRHEKTTLNFTLPREGQVGIDILDYLGRTVFSDKIYHPAGRHAAVIQVDKFPSGTYFLRFTHQGYTQTLPVLVRE